MYVLAATIQQTPPPPPTRKQFGTMMAVFLVVLGACMVMLAVSLVLLRVRTYRRAVARRLGLAEELAKARMEAGKARVDPWSESARRLEVEPRTPADDDTKDIDPEDIGPEDIEPDDDPRDWKGSR